MPSSDADAGPAAPPPPLALPTRLDWRGWLALAWVAWFGLLYGRTVVAQRVARLRAAVSRPAPPPAAPPIPARAGAQVDSVTEWGWPAGRPSRSGPGSDGAGGR